jgi:cell division protein FtsB
MSISPSVPESNEPNPYEAASTPRWIIVVFVAAFALIGYLLYAGNDLKNKLEAENTGLAQANSKQAVLSAQIDQTNSVVADLRGKLEVTTQKLGFTQAELAQARSLAQGIRDTQKQSDEKLTAQIGQVQQDANAKIGAVSTDLSGEERHHRDETGFGSDQGEADQHGRRPRRAERLDRPQSGRTRSIEAPG